MYNHSVKTLLALASLPFLIAGCNETADESAASSSQNQIESPSAEQAVVQAESEKPDTLSMAETTLVGTIIYKQIEGGFFAFIDKSGAHYTLHNLEAAYRKDGLIVEVSGVPQPDMMTTTQFGTVFKVNKVEVLDDSGAKSVIQNNSIL